MQYFPLVTVDPDVICFSHRPDFTVVLENASDESGEEFLLRWEASVIEDKFQALVCHHG